MDKWSYITHDFEPNISAKKCGFHTSFNGSHKNTYYMIEVHSTQLRTFKYNAIPNQEPVQSFVRTALLSGCNCKKNKSALFSLSLNYCVGRFSDDAVQQEVQMCECKVSIIA